MAGEGLQEMELEQGIVGISDIENPDSDSTRCSYSSSVNGDYSNMNHFEEISVHRLSGISGLSSVSGLQSASSSVNGSLPGITNRMLMSDKNTTIDYGTMEGKEEDTDIKNSAVDVADVQVELR